jgi:dolichol-phosphate mannosyltransferase
VSSRAIVVIPTYNEYDNIELLVDRILALPVPLDLFFVDDGSPDGTGRLLDELSASKPQLRVIHRPGKLGLGTAYRQAYRVLLKEPYDLFVQMDADLSHEPEEIPIMIRATEQADLVIGSRYCAGGGSRNWPLARHVFSRGANHLSRRVLGLSTFDSTAGFRCYRRTLLERLSTMDIRANGYAFQIEMTYYSHLLGFRVSEVPITFEDRRHATSKMSHSEIRSAIRTLARLAVHRIRRKGIDKGVQRSFQDLP